MLIIKKSAYARAGLLGNPSDGYNGKTIAISVRNYSASVVLYEWPEIEVLWSHNDQSRFGSIHELARDVRLHGYYGGIRLVKATIKRFVEYCDQQNISLHDGTFSIRYHSNIPRQVGLAGSSGIIIATLRALIEFYEIDIPLEVQPSLALSVESKELGIAAGLQDRVIQVYEDAVYMDFAQEKMRTIHGFECGDYTHLDPATLPPLYVAFSEEVGEPTEVTHAPLRVQYNAGVPAVVNAMTRFADFTVQGREAIQQGDAKRLGELIDANFDLRDAIIPLQPKHKRMVEVARSCGASGKFAGSGGAIIGTFSEGHFDELRDAMRTINCTCIRPEIV